MTFPGSFWNQFITLLDLIFVDEEVVGQQVGHQEHRPAGASADAWKQRAPDVVEGASGRLVEGAADVVDARQQRHDA